MNEQQFQDQIRECGLTEFKVGIHIVGRVGDMHPGWAENNVEAVIPAALARKGIMVDWHQVRIVGSDEESNEMKRWKISDIVVGQDEVFSLPEGSQVLAVKSSNATPFRVITVLQPVHSGDE